MKNFATKTAVVTGAAAGIGLAIAERFVQEGMKVVLADINEEALEIQVRRLAGQGHEVAARVTDVTSQASVQDLADFAAATYGDVHMVCNNAGIGGGAADDSPLWEASLSDWKWVMDINVWGVIHGIRAFVPLLQRHGQPAHIVNTASKAALLCGTSLYSTTKHGVIALTEALHAQLLLSGLHIGASVLCPGAVNTDLLRNSQRMRPTSAESVKDRSGANAFMHDYRSTVQTRMAAGQSPAEIADLLIDGLCKDEFYIFPGSVEDSPVEARFDNIRARRILDLKKSYPQFAWRAPA
jgi:NAD(P)-dependent dehydrogenase (short-subunit alcohol dehydrogenase family)